MKVSFILPIIFSCLMLSAQAQTTDSLKVQPAPADKAVIYFVRPSAMGFAINFSYFDSTKVVGRFAGPGYIRYECAPGKHIFWARSENRDFVEADLEAGKVYFMEAIVTIGAIKAGVDLEPIDPNDVKKMKQIIKLLNKKDAKSFTPEELAAQESELGDVIERGMKKYNAGRSEGIVYPLLPKDMYYPNL